MRRVEPVVYRVGVMASLWLVLTGSVLPGEGLLAMRLLFVPRQSWAQQAGARDDSYRYETHGRRDPFESLVKETPPPVVEPGPIIDPARQRGPLERFDLSALRLMGIVWGERGRRAVIRAPDGKGYFVMVGMYMGQNGGKVIAIEEDQLVIEERHRDQQGAIIGKTLTIQLRRKENQQG
jgi:Tfp pilus assembly protein PilP